MVSPETDELFAAAFAEGPFPEPGGNLAVDRMLRSAERTALLARLGWKAGRSELALDTFIMASARRAHRAAAVQHLVLTHALQVVGAALDRASVPWTILKFGALAISGVVEAGQREAGDLDILIANEDSRRGIQALCEIGFVPKGGRDVEHQFDPLVSAEFGVCLDIHKVILGVRLPGKGRSLDQAQLLENSLASPAPPPFKSGHIPSRRILLAHAVIHGIAHHGFRPCEYPLFRMVADVIDLTEARRTREALLAAFPFLERDLDIGVIEELADLCEAIRSGVPLSEIVHREGAPGARLLRHLLASSLSDEYAASLEFLHAKHRLSDRSFLLSRTQVLLGRLFVTRSEADSMSGKKLSPLGYAAVLARRPGSLWAKLRKSFPGPRQKPAPIVC